MKIYDAFQKELVVKSFDKNFERVIIKAERFLMVVRQLSPHKLNELKERLLATA